MTIQRKFTLVVAGKSESSFDEALEEAARLLKEGNLAGSNRNDDGGFYFDSTSDVPEGELPR